MRQNFGRLERGGSGRKAGERKDAGRNMGPDIGGSGKSSKRFRLCPKYSVTSLKNSKQINDMIIFLFGKDFSWLL